MYELRRVKRGIGEHSRETVLEADEKDPSCLTTGLPEVESGGVCGWSRDLGTEERNSADAFLGRKVSLLMTAPTPSMLDLDRGDPRNS